MFSYKEFYNCLVGCTAIAPKKDYRYYLNGIHMVQDEYGLVIEATDGHRLVRFTSECRLHGVDSFDVILDINYVKPLMDKIKALGYHKTDLNEVTITSVDDGFISFNVDTVKRVDGRYPETKRVIWTGEPEPTESIGLDCRYLADIQKVVKPFKGNKFLGVKMEFQGPNTSTKITFGTGVVGLDCIMLIMPCRL